MRTGLALLALMMLTAGCGEDPKAKVTADGLTKATLALNWKPEPQFGGFYAAEVTGAYARHKLQVTIEPGGSGTPTIQMLAAGKVDFAIVSADEVLLGRSNDMDVVALFATFQTNPQGIMVRKSRGLSQLSEVFAGGKLVVQAGLPYARSLKNKYSFDKVEVIPCAGGISLYLSDEMVAQQCFVTSEPLLAKDAGVEPQVFLVADSGYNPYTTVLACRGKLLRENRAVVEGMVRAVREGWTAYLADPDSTNAAMGKLNPVMDARTFKLSADAQRPLIETEETKANGLGYMTVQRWMALRRQLTDLGELRRDVPVSEAFQAVR